jgi:hypothetical protein
MVRNTTGSVVSIRENERIVLGARGVTGPIGNCCQTSVVVVLVVGAAVVVAARVVVVAANVVEVAAVCAVSAEGGSRARRGVPRQPVITEVTASAAIQ